jgi:hypothetical protein
VEKKTIIIVSVQAMWGSIEWILPACKHLKDNYDGVEIYFLIQRRRKSELFQTNLELEGLTNEITGKKCFDLFDISPDWLKSFSKILLYFDRKIPGTLFSWFNDSWIKVNWKIFNKVLFKKWIDRVKPDIGLMDSHRNELFSELKKTGINIGFYLTSPSFAFSPDVWVDEHKRYLMYSDSPFDFFLVDTKWAADFFKSIAKKRPVFQVGCPKFDTFWMDCLKKKYAGNSNSVTRSNQKPNILVLLANESSFIFNSISFEESLNEIIHACSKAKNACLTIKPHPRQDLLLLEGIINRYPEIDIEISNEPSFALIDRAQVVIAMPTGVIIDVLISGRPVIEYFNYVKLNKVLKEEFGEIPKGAFGGMGYLNKKNCLTSVFRELGFVLTADRQDELELLIQKVFSDNFLLEQKDIRNIFPEYASKKAVEAVMSFKDHSAIMRDV